MTHYGSLGTQAVSEDVRDIRGTDVRGADNTKLGDVTDVIIDHEAMEIRYVVMDSGGWLEAGTFLLPADRMSADETDENNLTAGVTRQQIHNSPKYDKKTLHSEDEWKKYEREFKKYWDEEPILHMKDSYRIITPPEEPNSAQPTSSSEVKESDAREQNPANLFPERMTHVFSDPAPGSGKVTLRPKSVARAEEAAAGVALLKPRWWDAFENYLRLNKDDIQAKCPQCESKAA
jgi:hypothetical protein